MLGKTVIAKSGLGGPFWFCATRNSVNCRKATYKKLERLGTAPHEKMYSTKKHVSKSNFRPFSCRVYMHLNKDSGEKGRHALKGIEAINLGFASD
jgi:hypothetical protein